MEDAVAALPFGIYANTTDLDAAPESLLKFVRCKCKLSGEISVEAMYALAVNMDVLLLVDTAEARAVGIPNQWNQL